MRRNAGKQIDYSKVDSISLYPKCFANYLYNVSSLLELNCRIKKKSQELHFHFTENSIQAANPIPLTQLQNTTEGGALILNFVLASGGWQVLCQYFEGNG